MSKLPHEMIQQCFIIMIMNKHALDLMNFTLWHWIIKTLLHYTTFITTFIKAFTLCKDLLMEYDSLKCSWLSTGNQQLDDTYVKISLKYLRIMLWLLINISLWKEWFKNNLSRGLKEKCYNTVILITSVAIFHFYHIRHKIQWLYYNPNQWSKRNKWSYLFIDAC